jgi:putative SOS response-associated peptidase YedK
MCASYILKQKLRPELPWEFRSDWDFNESYDRLITPHSQAPVLVDSGQGFEIRSMKFSLLPHWSKEPKIKFATHNARIESVADKPTWRSPFIKRHCVVLLTDFVEPIYLGPLSGHMVSFHAEAHSWLLAAGLWDEWTNHETGEVIESFAILTTTPLEFVESQGHDRSPLFVGAAEAKSWLSLKADAQTNLEFLKQSSMIPALNARPIRALKPGWEKKA